jgi:hypothetical protein
VPKVRVRCVLTLVAVVAAWLPAGAARADGTVLCAVNYVLGRLDEIRAAPSAPASSPATTTEGDDIYTCTDSAQQEVNEQIEFVLDQAGKVGPLADGLMTEFVTIVNGVIDQSQYFVGIPDQIPIFSAGDVVNDLNRCGGPIACTTRPDESPAQWSFAWRMRVYTSGNRDMYAYGQYYEWGGTGAGGRVTYLWTACYDYGGFYEYNGCTTTSTPTGNRSVGVDGHWEYRCCFNNGVGYPKRPHADATVHADTTIQGTVYTG